MAIGKDTRTRILEIGSATLLGAGLMFAISESRRWSGCAPSESAPAASSPDAADAGASLDLSEASTAATTVASAQDSGSLLDADGKALNPPPLHAPTIEADATALARYPKTGVIAVALATIRDRPNLQANRIGLLRAGAKIRVSEARPGGDGCKFRWYEVFPQGWACLSNEALKLDVEVLDPTLMPVAPLDEQAPLPVEYWRVTQNATPVFHRLPTHREQEQADAIGQAWLAEHGTALMPMEGPERPADVPNFVKEYYNAGYWVTVFGEFEKNRRVFRQTNTGAYVRKAALEQRESSNFRGLALGEAGPALPLYWIVREVPLKQRQGQSNVLVDTNETLVRRSRHPFVRKVRIDELEYYEDEQGKLLRDYAVGVAQKLRRPPGVTADEHWIHVDLSEQVVVAYDGDRPVYTTLVSTGKEPGMTPIGVFRVQSKHVVTPMRDAPMDSEAYSIEDVPWTQYFANSVALHGAFWHGGFGLVRSHGCVNLAPLDAKWLFGFTAPALPAGYLATWADVADHGRGSPVVITE